ncbi:hypothetical protein BASA81_018209 [Batrachochytrium salamandrivorans]|nr:hypothetical protein BASA81_018209 [Batrachochytrium salamandrivorans]
MIRDADTQTDDNLLVSLTKAVRADTDIGGGLTERELIGNIFIFMFAGHETTAGHTDLCIGLCLLPHPATQQHPTVFRPERWFSSPDCAKHATKTSEFFRDSAKSRTQSGQSASQCTLLTTREYLPMTVPLPHLLCKPHLSIFSYNRFAFIPFLKAAFVYWQAICSGRVYHDTCTDCPEIYHTFT